MKLKQNLLRLGPDSQALLLVFRLQAGALGFRVHVAKNTVWVTRGDRRIVLAARERNSIPFAVHLWEHFFEVLEAERRDGYKVLDFSKPAMHRYRKSGLAFYFPAFAEDDCMDAYTAAYTPKTGDVVWDVGAHAGSTSYFFAQMVGPAGRVYAFEPDEKNFDFLLRNIKLHGMENVIPVKAALSNRTGRAKFCMDGTMAAGLSEFLPYAAEEHSREVETLSFEDACERFGRVPDLVKIDIEGGELSVISGALEFLKQTPVRLVIESNHFVEGEFTSGRLEAMLRDAGYRAWSSDEFGQRFTWAKRGS